jgi:phospholipid/cholesterol/gamma-HCH transport system substrate-binding protein
VKNSTNWSTELKVGSFVAGAALIIGYMFFVLSPDVFHRKNKQNYYTLVDNAAGIVAKTSVKTNGVSIGRVVDVKLLNNETRIEMEIEGQVKIPTGSEAVIKEKGLLGDVFLEIIRGKDIGQYLHDGDFIPPSMTHMSMSALISNAGEVAQDLKKIANSFAGVFGGPEGSRNIHDIVFDLRDLIKGMKEVLQENRNNVRETVGNLQQTTRTLQAVLGGNQAALQDIVVNVKELTGGIRTLVTGENKEKIEQILASLDKTMQNLEVVMKDARSISGKVNSGQGTLGRLVNDDVALTKIEDALTDFRKVLAPATKLQVQVGYRGEFRKDESTQHYFDLVFRTRPDRFYLLGVTDVSETVRDTTYESLSSSNPASPDAKGASSKTRERISEKRAIRFNLQFGKRWYNAQLRFGLFETTGGFAGDFFLLHDRLKISLEAFDWDTHSGVRKTAHLKAYIGLLFFQHIYGYVGVDDITRIDPVTNRIQKVPNYFLGAGLDFTDEDLTALFGAASLAK